ncbi:Inner membrane ABC transporter permease protein YtfT [Lacunisphaera limnophila]|uniref:Inner membrane ABC transporter permease protein YtfT n=1 Tax=Lacunisphaera limnophila TaxID=1838286 RepID=A0A1D8AZT0_9BACT|nr:ABC transporter permease [Lacunisphaera limnophila]AOS46364.1 Inner membrane ABC transporter permease protein YtfT [Lacunisphaera limnophila]
MTDRLRHFLKSPVLWPLAGIFLLLVANLVLKPGFLTITVLDGHLYGLPIDVLNRGAKTLILALGMTLVIATGGVDLSVGSVVAITGAVAAVLIGQGTDSLVLILGGAIAAGGLAGLINGLLVARLGVQPIVATLILMVAGRGVAQVLTDGQVLIIKHEAFGFLGNGFVLGLPFTIVCATLLYLAVHFALRRTAAGLFIEAVGDNPEASRFAGLATARIKILAYVACGLCAGLAGVMEAANIGAADAQRAGENMELDAIFAVVVGGTALTGGRFLLLGSFVGALLLQMLITTMYNLGVPPAVAPVPKALLILTVCLLQSDRTRRWLGGLFKKKAAA